MCAPRWGRGCLWERLEAGTTKACVWWGPQECGQGPTYRRFGQKERAARTSRGPEPRATGPGATAPKGGACEIVVVRGRGGCLAEAVVGQALVGQALRGSTQCPGAGVSGWGEHCGPGC